LVSVESAVVLWHGEQKKSTVPSVEAEEASFLDSVFSELNSTHFVVFWLQLHCSLDVFSWVSAGDFDCTSDTTYILINISVITYLQLQQGMGKELLCLVF
jgi:hypothetical protein